MPIGKLSWRLVLDNPALIHYGPSSVVTGHVLLSYTASTGQELFGPLQITVTFEGRAKTKLWRESGGSKHYYRGRAQLFNLAIGVHDGPLRLTNGSEVRYPFAIQFPDRVDQRVQQPAWQPHHDFDVSLNAPLPPSMEVNAQVTPSAGFQCFCEYRVDAIVNMPQINVKIDPLIPRSWDQRDGEVVYYQPTRAPATIPVPNTPLAMSETVVTRNKYLLPIEQRPSGFRQHAKNFLSGDQYPVFMYEMVVKGKTSVYLTQPLHFEISLRPDLERSTAPEIPAIQLVSFQVQFKARTQVRTEATCMGFEYRNDGCETIARFEGAVEPGDFSKANDYTRRVETAPITGIPSNFSTFNITRSYTMVLSISILTANKTQKVKREFLVDVLPPPNAAGARPPAEVGASSGGDQLPEYQAPPAY